MGTAERLRIMANRSGLKVGGKIDEVRFYDRAISPQEVQALYALGAGAPRSQLDDLQCRMECTSEDALTIGWDDLGEGTEYTLYWTTNLMEGFLPIMSNLTGNGLTIDLPEDRKGFFKVGTESAHE